MGKKVNTRKQAFMSYHDLHSCTTNITRVRYKLVKLAYSEFVPVNGTDEKLSPIIFLHGITATRIYWFDIPQYIADGSRRKVYTLDSRNHGESEYTGELSVDANVEDLFHFMDTIHVHKAVIVGHSMGGLTAIKAALTKPERVSMIIVEDMFTKKITKEILDPVIELTTAWIETVQSIPTGLSESEAAAFAVAELFKKTPPNMPQVKDPEVLGKSRLILKKLPGGKYDVNFNKEVILSTLKDADGLQNELSGEFKGPACFIYGSVSPFQVGRAKDDVKKYFPSAEFFEVEGATHHVHMEHPDIFKETVLTVLKNTK